MSGSERETAALMTDHRFEARAAIEPGEHELGADGRPMQLVRVVLTDAGPITRDDGSTAQRPDVVCPLRPSEARELAVRLLELAHEAGDASMTVGGCEPVVAASAGAVRWRPYGRAAFSDRARRGRALKSTARRELWL